MRLRFFIKFSSKYGDSLQIVFNKEDAAHEAISFQLKYLDEDYWDVSLLSAALPNEQELNYSVIQLLENGEEREIISNRTIDLSKIKYSEIQIIDGPEAVEQYKKVFETVPFKKVFLNKGFKPKKHSDRDGNVIFKVKVPALGDNNVVCITGSSKKLKAWNEEKPLQLMQKDGFWVIKLNFLKEQYPLEYKFGIYDTEEKKIISFEEGDNRVLRTPADKDTLTIFHAFPNINNSNFKAAGLNLPISALRTEQTWGIGSFSSLHLVIDLAKKTGIKLLQLLPINDTSATLTNKDSYPYAPISVFALHPIYLNVQKLSTAFGLELSIETMERIHALNLLPQLDYEGVLQLKIKTLQHLYSLEKQSFKNDFAWFEFFDLNRHWLLPYAAFCFLRDKYGTANVTLWPAYSVYNEDEIQELASPENANYDAIALHYFIQYHLHLQLKDATHYAHKNEIIVKGDLPIGVGRNSVDTWMYPHLFHLDMQAGAPPDAFATTGQNWSFPTYNWDAMAKDNYAWWRQRLEHMEDYFDAVRIDHVIGFYRIWSIPMHSKEGILGHFHPAIPITQNYFDDIGLHFDFDRYCRPHIAPETINKYFGEKALWVNETFIYAGYIKKEFDTGKKIADYFTAHPENADIQQGLLKLLANLILLENATPGNYHFRINMQQTDSFKLLTQQEQQKLNVLYNRYFFETQNELWEKEGRKKLSALKSCTNMMLCAEDLGMVPAMVEGMLNEMEIFSLQVQRMPKTATENFAHPKNAAYLSVVTPSTHDMSTLREWWEDEKEHIQYFYNYLLGHAGEAPYFCDEQICRD
ncbi:MAG: 4-alpha-glucanotransferase, partial [Ferruginibacter sp.]